MNSSNVGSSYKRDIQPLKGEGKFLFFNRSKRFFFTYSMTLSMRNVSSLKLKNDQKPWSLEKYNQVKQKEKE